MVKSLSVIIPAYNGAAYIGEAVKSVFTQKTLPKEIIVVDDASSDATTAVVESAFRRAPLPAQLIRLPKNSGGPARPINVGVGAASGDYVTVLDQDDLFLPTRIEEHTRVLASFPELSIAFGCGEVFGAPGTVTPDAEIRAHLRHLSQPLSPEFSGWHRIQGDNLLRLLVWKNCFVGYPAFTFRKSDWSAKGGVDASLKIASDYDFQCFLSTRGDAAYRPEPMYLRRIHLDNVTHNNLRTNLEGAVVRERYLKSRRELLAHPDLRDELYAWFLGFGYWLREANKPWHAIRLYRSTARLFGWDSAVLLGLAKVLLKAPVYKVTRRSPQMVKMTRSGSSR